MSPGPRPSAAEPSVAESVALAPVARREALLRAIDEARRHLVLSLFRCDDQGVLDALAAAVRRGVAVEALLTRRARRGRKSLGRLHAALTGMGATVAWFADPVVKYHAKYLVADETTALVMTLNPTRKCFGRTWDAVITTGDTRVARSLLRLFDADASGRPPVFGPDFSPRLLVGPERSRDEVHRLILDARRSIGILDHKLADPGVVTLLRERRNAGVAVTVVGKDLPSPLAAHGKLMVVDETRALVGSLALSTLSLDFRREVSLMVDDPALVQPLAAAWRALSDHAGARARRLPGDPS
ncbi:phospholipase D-like domain-containing protein [Luteitalea sp.]|jgi:cardiolipin synthase|uniref:phospholipase D-like domain-containing protein n=1 Tax=Luteitalea sp. TaxID=2004800 RepID=UPI0037CCBC0B